jgi:beta-galactosidase
MEWNTLYRSELMFAISHPESSRTLATYESDFYKGMPVLSVNQTGKGKTYYFGTRSETSFYHAFMKQLCIEQEILHETDAELPEGMEISVREKDGKQYIFFLNHKGQEQHAGLENSISLTKEMTGVSMLDHKKYQAGEILKLEPYGVEILYRE